MIYSHPNKWLSSLLIVATVLLSAGAFKIPPAARAAGIIVDKLVTTHQSSGARTIVSPAFSTTSSNELLVAFITSDGPNSTNFTFSSVTGSNLTWRLRQRTNAQKGTAEIWQAVAPNILTNATVTATRSSGSYAGSITVATFIGASTTIDGAIKSGNATTGAPTATLTTTTPGSWVWATGNDWDKAITRTVGANQTKVDEFLASTGDTFWVQRQTNVTASAGTAVTLNDTTPTTDRWNLSLIEIPPAVNDTIAPTEPTNLTANAISSTRVDLSWSASTDNVGVAGYYILRNTVQIGTTGSLTYSDTTAVANTTYSYTIKAYDGSNNISPASNTATVTTPTPPLDTTPPTVSLTAPANNTTVSGTINVTANANDNIGVSGVQFTLDGNSLGNEDATSPYSVSWNTTTATDGTHSLAAIARDASNNSTTAQTVTVTVSNSATDPAQVGQWGLVSSWPEVSIHGALTPTGKVLTFQGDFSQGGQQYLYNPADGTTKQVPNAAADLFCAGQAVTADGRILVIGGTSTSGGLGIRNITAFDPGTESWQNLAPMHYPRWYATGTTLGDGRILVTSGSNTSADDIVGIPELYDVKNNSWSDLTGANKVLPIYPFIYQLPDGRILHAGGSEVPTATEVLNIATQTWTTLDSRIIDGASIVNYAPGKFMKAGSAADSGNSGPSAKTAFTLDMNQPNPTWQPTADMAFPRSFANLTNLPDGTVLATGGESDKSGFVNSNGVLPAEIWNPATGTWRTVASMTTPRLYHSIAVLLPDGRVFISGGGGDPGVPDQQNFQIYSPTYLFKGPRPTISSAPTTVQYNSNAFVQTPDAASITSVSLIRTGSVTHSFDQNTRALSLNFSQGAGGLNVQMPIDGNTAPPGYYMLSIVNGQGVPSVASMVRFPAPYEDNVAPSAPSNLTANGNIGTATLNWTASTDNSGVSAYDVYRSNTAGFTPSQSNKISQVTGATTTFLDSGVAVGTYYYQIKAEDAAGNISPASNEARADVIADTTKPTAPANLQATSPNAHQVNLTWTASSDDVGVNHYNILRDNVLVGTSNGTSYTDTTVLPTTTYNYTVTAEDTANNVSDPSNVAPITTGSSLSLAIDKTVITHQSSGASTITSPALTTTNTNELLVAFLTSDGPSSGAQTFSSLTGGGLTWTLRKRTNTQAGTAEIWQAIASNPLTNATFTATRSSGTYQGSMVISAFTGASMTQNGATASGNATTGAPSVSLTTTSAGSWVWGVGDDWDTATARTVGANQTKVDEFLALSGDTFWVQRQTNTTPNAGTNVTLSDTAPTSDRWNLAAIEIIPQ